MPIALGRHVPGASQGRSTQRSGDAHDRQRGVSAALVSLSKGRAFGVVLNVPIVYKRVGQVQHKGWRKRRCPKAKFFREEEWCEAFSFHTASLSDDTTEARGKARLCRQPTHVIKEGEKCFWVASLEAFASFSNMFLVVLHSATPLGWIARRRKATLSFKTARKETGSITVRSNQRVNFSFRIQVPIRFPGFHAAAI